MKEYIKPEVEYVKFDSETVTAESGSGNGTVGIVSAEVEYTWPTN